jgi:hypothetical protein
MSEWQPAIVHHGHAEECRRRNMRNAPTVEQEKRENGKRILVRTADRVSPFCGGRVYKIHPSTPVDSIVEYICEHEILTD